MTLLKIMLTEKSLRCGFHVCAEGYQLVNCIGLTSTRRMNPHNVMTF
eukprot:UN01478